MELQNLLLKLDTIFQSEGESVYAVGGAVRDYLLGRPLYDFDFATSATPEIMKKLFPEGNFAFAKYGNVSIELDGKHLEITTLREEEYGETRHPSKITFVKEVKLDAKRRDFTINAMYLTPAGRLIDFYGGHHDLNIELIRMIGDPFERLKEDPLRILRALRFKLILGFKLEEQLEQAIIKLAPLVKSLNPQKANSEIAKMREIDEEKANQILNKYGIH